MRTRYSGIGLVYPQYTFLLSSDHYSNIDIGVLIYAASMLKRQVFLVVSGSLFSIPHEHLICITCITPSQQNIQILHISRALKSGMLSKLFAFLNNAQSPLWYLGLGYRNVGLSLQTLQMFTTENNPLLSLLNTVANFNFLTCRVNHLQGQYFYFNHITKYFSEPKPNQV